MTGWISVKDKMPKRQHWTECGSEWVYVKQNGIVVDDECQYDYTTEKWRDRELYFICDVTHWKPLRNK